MFKLANRTELRSAFAGGAFRLLDPEVFRLVERVPAGRSSLEALLDWLESDV